jgi:hypothetical protein
MVDPAIDDQYAERHARSSRWPFEHAYTRFWRLRQGARHHALPGVAGSCGAFHHGKLLPPSPVVRSRLPRSPGSLQKAAGPTRRRHEFRTCRINSEIELCDRRIGPRRKAKQCFRIRQRASQGSALFALAHARVPSYRHATAAGVKGYGSIRRTCLNFRVATWLKNIKFPRILMSNWHCWH